MLKNASAQAHTSVTLPFSKMKQAIADCLVKEGYIASVSKKTKKGFPILEIALAYNQNGMPKISDVKRISKPSRRVYSSVKEVYKVRNGFGSVILSTPKGILSGKDARKEQVGGEVLFSIW